ncbi:MAG TPA: peptidylprolyl isomerase [Bacteroidia bacterium]|jgi:cyclophilin family peptidyl-prolyl cis-trans isomerase|nr:peptidylprolyl isomerase [Bacteroidia bacterium]
MKKTVLLLIITITFIAKLQAQTQVTFYTTKGTFIVQLDEAKRPITTKNFIGLVKKKFYDKLTFHRVIDGFMIQGGDPKGDGTGGTGGTIPDELSPKLSNAQKTIAMANLGTPNTADCQFYINLVNNTSLDAKYTAFGTVISNFTVVQTIGKVATNSNDKPLTPVVMDSVRITSISTAIENFFNGVQNILLYPNPATTESIIFLNATKDETMQFSIYNQQGQLITRVQRKIETGENSISFKEIQETDLAPGVYFIMLQGGEAVSTEKFIVLE